MTFNLSKITKKSDSIPTPYYKRLEEQNEDNNRTTSGDKLENYHGLLEKNRGEGQDGDDRTTEWQIENNSLQKRQSPDMITDTQMNESSGFHRGEDTGESAIMTSINALSEGYNQLKQRKHKESIRKDLGQRVIDKDIGKQRSTPGQKINNNVPRSGTQLPNIYEKFEDIPISKSMAKKMASLSLMDSELFKIYYKNALSEKDLSEQDKKQIHAINENKKQVLADIDSEDPLNQELDELLDAALGDGDLNDVDSPDFDNIHDKEKAEIEQNDEEYSEDYIV